MQMPRTLVSLAVLVHLSPTWAQLAPVNEMGLSMGHIHLAAPDREKEAKACLALGGQLESFNRTRQAGQRRIGRVSDRSCSVPRSKPGSGPGEVERR